MEKMVKNVSEKSFVIRGQKGKWVVEVFSSHLVKLGHSVLRTNKHTGILTYRLKRPVKFKIYQSNLYNYIKTPGLSLIRFLNQEMYSLFYDIYICPDEGKYNSRIFIYLMHISFVLYKSRFLITFFIMYCNPLLYSRKRKLGQVLKA